MENEEEEEALILFFLFPFVNLIENETIDLNL